MFLIIHIKYGKRYIISLYDGVFRFDVFFSRLYLPLIRVYIDYSTVEVVNVTPTTSYQWKRTEIFLCLLNPRNLANVSLHGSECRHVWILVLREMFTFLSIRETSSEYLSFTLITHSVHSYKSMRFLLAITLCFSWRRFLWLLVSWLVEIPIGLLAQVRLKLWTSVQWNEHSSYFIEKNFETSTFVSFFKQFRPLHSAYNWNSSTAESLFVYNV